MTLNNRSKYGAVSRTSAGIPIFDSGAFEAMHIAGRVAAEVLDEITPLVVENVTTGEIDDAVMAMIRQRGAIPASLGYKGFPCSCCISPNHVVCHGIPGSRVLRKGDILNIDVAVIVDGWYGDTSRMYAVGRPSVKASRLIKATHEALMLGIKAVVPGGRFGDIGEAIHSYADSCGYSVVDMFCGHGLGRVFHDLPAVFHCREEKETDEILPGMLFTIEPMINQGQFDVKVLSDGWTAVTKDRSLSAQFEHSLGVTENGVEIFTKSPASIFFPQNMP